MLIPKEDYMYHTAGFFLFRGLYANGAGFVVSALSGNTRNCSTCHKPFHQWFVVTLPFCFVFNIHISQNQSALPLQFKTNTGCPLAPKSPYARNCCSYLKVMQTTGRDNASSTVWIHPSLYAVFPWFLAWTL